MKLVGPDQILFDLIDIGRHGGYPFHIVNIIVNPIHHLVCKLLRIRDRIVLYGTCITLEVVDADYRQWQGDYYQKYEQQFALHAHIGKQGHPASYSFLLH
ncbi:hypothetical protein D3C81_855310 [compost metagenome]